MKTFSSMAAQGDLLLRKVERLPANLKPVPTQDGYHVVAHSETSHHHAIAEQMGAVAHFAGGDPLVSWLRVDSPVVLEHHRPWDTHEPIRIEPGCYELRRQREHTPEGWRRVED